jgi:hypothetical protein
MVVIVVMVMVIVRHMRVTAIGLGEPQRIPRFTA